MIGHVDDLRGRRRSSPESGHLAARATWLGRLRDGPLRGQMVPDRTCRGRARRGGLTGAPWGRPRLIHVAPTLASICLLLFCGSCGRSRTDAPPRTSPQPLPLPIASNPSPAASGSAGPTVAANDALDLMLIALRPASSTSAAVEAENRRRFEAARASAKPAERDFFDRARKFAEENDRVAAIWGGPGTNDDKQARLI